MPDKSAETVAHLLLEEIIPDRACLFKQLQIMAMGNVNQVMIHILECKPCYHFLLPFSRKLRGWVISEDIA